MSILQTSNSSSVIYSLMNMLPDNRPITALQVYENHEKCPKNFNVLSRTYDQDVDADLWREKVLIGKRIVRYLCVSKSEGSSDHVLDAVKVIGEKERPPDDFVSLAKTADSNTKAWRKKQIVYKLSKRETVKEAITDVILCSKSKYSPQDYQLAGDINGILVFYKKTTLSEENDRIDLITMGFQNLGVKSPPPLYPRMTPGQNDYENVRSPNSGLPLRPAPKPPGLSTSLNSPLGKPSFNTLGPNYSELEGVPFELSSRIKEKPQFSFDPSSFKTRSTIEDYDFSLERQVLCTTKAITNRNPFFQ